MSVYKLRILINHLMNSIILDIGNCRLFKPVNSSVPLDNLISSYI